MIPAFAEKKLLVAPPAAIVNTGSLACNVIDTIGFDYLVVDVFLGATDIALTVCKLQQSDVKASGTTLTSGTDISGMIYGTSNNDTGSASTLPSASADNTIVSFFLDLRGRNRYILPVVTVGTGSTGAYGTVAATLMRAAEGPRTAAQSGYAQRLVA